MFIRMCGIRKRFAEVLALDGVDLEIRSGEVIGLLGKNGAGKSTLMKLLYGVHRPDAGAIEVDSAAVSIQSPRDAVRPGIGMVARQKGQPGERR